VSNLNDQTNKIKRKNHKKHNYPKMAQTVMFSPLRVPVLSSGLLRSRRPSQTPTRERSAPTSAWSCVVIGARIAPRQPSQHWHQCRHHQELLDMLDGSSQLILLAEAHIFYTA
jgi:hypothetical protein